MVPGGEALGRVDWVPVDVLASSVWELARPPAPPPRERRGVASPEVFHLVNPAPRPWGELLPAVVAWLRLGTAPREASMEEWVAELERTGLGDRDAVASRPAVKILEFFRDVGKRQGVTGDRGVAFSTEEAVKWSEALRGLGPVREEWVTRWMKDLGF